MGHNCPMGDRVVDAVKLRELREDHRWSVRELSRRSGVSERAVKYAEGGQVRTTTLVLRALADALGVGVEDLTTDSAVQGRGTPSREAP